MVWHSTVRLLGHNRISKCLAFDECVNLKAISGVLWIVLFQMLVISDEFASMWMVSRDTISFRR